MPKNTDFCKIVATIGPDTSNEKSIEALVNAGVSVFRCNCSHGSLPEYQERVTNIRKMEKKYNKLDKDFRSVVANCKAYKLEIGELHNKLSNQKDLYNRCLQENEELKRCKCLLPKRICFIKNIKEQDIKKLYENGFELKSEWTDLLKNEIDGIDYVQSWIVHKGFNYKEIIEIKDFFHKKEIKIEEFLNINTLMRKLEGEL